MTHITMRENESRYQIKISGHSGYAESGADIVCSAISILAHAWASLCIEMSDEKRIKLLKLEMREGYTNIVVSDPMQYTFYAWEMLKIGVRDLTDSYHENIDLEWGE